MRTRGRRTTRYGEILRFVGHQSFAEFHDAHRVRWYAVIGKYEFSEPEIAAADNSPDRKTLLVWLEATALLNVVPAADPLARLRIIKHSILAVDFMFDLEIARVRPHTMAIRRPPNGSIPHLKRPRLSFRHHRIHSAAATRQLRVIVHPFHTGKIASPAAFSATASFGVFVIEQTILNRSG